MFVDQGTDHLVPSSAPDITISANMEAPGEQSPLQSRPKLDFTTPPSFQPRKAADGLRVNRRHRTDGPLPAEVRNAFLVEEQPRMAASQPHLHGQDCFTILHRIVNLLHRSLKPKEEIVREIAADYRENATKLLQNLSMRHDQEKKGIFAALRRASQTLFSIFSSAKQDLAVLIENIRGMDITHTGDVLTRPALTQKLDAVAKLCRARLRDNGTELPDGEGLNGPDHDELQHSYQQRLMNALHGVDDQTRDSLDKIASEVDDFIQQCLEGKMGVIVQREENAPEKPAKKVENADEALEVLLDGILDSLKDNGENGSH
ncbi:hypothetical protein VTJ49DRAFT_1676 [Mycothermus thermophilus]|uniref:Uncharacterized protein n=1 Tax=Humicola insolens TaxID=85995 RepID=A0ABR3VD06_HUMIN